VSTPEVQFASEGRVAFLTFNRPDARNAMTWSMYDALAEACERVDADDQIRVFVLRTTGDAFVSGTDISQFVGLSTAEGLEYERKMERTIDRLERVSAATVAQVQGAAVGGGCLLALACDLRVCTPAARFGVPVARTLGNCLSAANYARLVDLIGPARTKDLLFTARLIDAPEADALGLITRLVDATVIDAVVAELAESIADRAPLTIRATKAAIRRIGQTRRPDPIESEDFLTACYGSSDFREGIAAFLAKRTPRFTGR
jgi:enoyl-CoA hydratase